MERILPQTQPWAPMICAHWVVVTSVVTAGGRWHTVLSGEACFLTSHSWYSHWYTERGWLGCETCPSAAVLLVKSSLWPSVAVRSVQCPVAGGVVILRQYSPSCSHAPFPGEQQLGQECSMVWAAVTLLL